MYEEMEVATLLVLVVLLEEDEEDEEGWVDLPWRLGCVVVGGGCWRIV